MPDAQDAIEAIKRENAPAALVFYVVHEDR
jgi:hypothetical protein